MIRHPLFGRSGSPPLDPHLPPGPAPSTPEVAAFFAAIPPLLARVYAPEVEEIAAALAPDSLTHRLALAARWLEQRAAWGALRSEIAGLRGAPRGSLWAALVKITPDAPWHDRLGDWLATWRDLDADAALERLDAQIEGAGIRLELLALLVGDTAHPTPHKALAGPMWAQLTAWLAQESRAATRRALVRACVRRITALPPDRALEPLHLTHQLLARLSSPDSDPLTARAVVALLPSLGWRGIEQIQQLLTPSEGRNHFLVRARVVEVAVAWAGPALTEAVAEDPSETVRMAWIHALAERADEACRDTLVTVALEDPTPIVRVVAMLALAQLSTEWPELLPVVLGGLRDLPLLARWTADALGEAWSNQPTIRPEIVAALQVACRSESPMVASRAAYALERLTQLRILPMPLHQLPPGSTALLPASLLTRTSLDALARTLSAYAAEGLGFCLQPTAKGVEVTRGDTLRFRWWRFFHELGHPSPSKRVGYSHLLAPAPAGPIRIPPGRMAEATPTTVPGQRVFVPSFGSWGPFLPSPTDYLDALSQGPVRLVTLQGDTTITPPPSWRARWRARIALTFRFAQLDALRRASLHAADATGRASFVRALQQLGFTTAFSPSPLSGGNASPAIRDLFVASSWLAPLALLQTPYRNTASEVGLGLGLLVVSMVALSLLQRHQIRSLRAQIPLVIGGWGTRGKSGSERLKAALFEGLGISVFSKTTGCEAMFLHAPPGAHAQEIFLFRPLDQATIWENVTTLQLATSMRARVYLWECMALQERYVDLLQNQWLRDDASTITNAYPDHEDIQGPTGLDVAQSISNFAPTGSLLVHSEEHMVPIIEEKARARGTHVVHVGHGLGQLLPDDLKARFPYQEHPRNLTMVATLAETLGVPPLDAMILMADHVVPDLGALLATPAVPYEGRAVRFLNGHSANDLASFSACWGFTGLSTHDPRNDPDRWITLVVNNRHDRVARSEVFARILVQHAPAHRYVLIGTNLEGFRQYTEDALSVHLATLTLPDASRARVEQTLAWHKPVHPLRLAQRCLQNLGVPTHAEFGTLSALQGFASALAEWQVTEPLSLEEARASARALLPSLAPLSALVPHGQALRDDDERARAQLHFADALLEAAARWKVVDSLAAYGESGAPVATVEALLRQRWAELFRANLILLHDPYATRDQVLQAVVDASPPGVRLDILGCQNIKGTGLDWVYGWMDLLHVLQELPGLQGSASEQRRAMDALTTRRGWGLISALHARHTLAALSLHGPPLDPLLHDARTATLAALDHEITRRRSRLPTSGGDKSLLARALAWIEPFFEPLDAIRRRRRADQVFTDLRHHRISHTAAATKLRALTERQKGGWLVQDVRAWGQKEPS